MNAKEKIEKIIFDIEELATNDCIKASEISEIIAANLFMGYRELNDVFKFFHSFSSHGVMLELLYHRKLHFSMVYYGYLRMNPISPCKCGFGSVIYNTSILRRSKKLAFLNFY